MIRSMTGFGRAERSSAGWRCAVELRSVNGRYLEVRLKLPNGLSHLEEGLKKRVKARCERGKLEGAMTLAPVADGENPLALNQPLLRGLGRLVREAQAVLDQPLGISLGDLLAVRDLVQFEAWEPAGEEVARLAAETLDEALERLLAMRETEGAALAAELAQRTEVLAGLVGRAGPLTEALPAQYARRLRENVVRLAGDVAVPEERLAQEIALAAEKLDVSEEITRFNTHLVHLRQILDAGGAVGRRIDFLLQELNREANTLGAKSNDAEVSALVIEMKSEIERLREQVQNVE